MLSLSRAHREISTGIDEQKKKNESKQNWKKYRTAHLVEAIVFYFIFFVSYSEGQTRFLALKDMLYSICIYKMIVFFFFPLTMHKINSALFCVVWVRQALVSIILLHKWNRFRYLQIVFCFFCAQFILYTMMFLWWFFIYDICLRFFFLFSSFKMN